MATEHRGGSGNFAEDRERASQAGQKGGQQSHPGSQTHTGSQAMDRDRERGQQGGNFAQDREKASEAGRKGGQHSHGGRS
jgi:uncharacterized protein